jgi:hypothetical protein
LLDGDLSYASRSLLSEVDLSEPLATLYDFGHVRDAPGAYEAALLRGPRVLLGARTALISNPAERPREDALVDRALHLALEGHDPASGLRFCRTYFLQAATAKSLDAITKEVVLESAMGPQLEVRTKGRVY